MGLGWSKVKNERRRERESSVDGQPSLEGERKTNSGGKEHKGEKKMWGVKRRGRGVCFEVWKGYGDRTRESGQGKWRKGGREKKRK